MQICLYFIVHNLAYNIPQGFTLTCIGQNVPLELYFK